MNLVMPLMSIYICFIMPVSMGLYWIEQSVLGIIQEAILNRYYKTKLDAEMAEFNEAQRKKDAEMEAKRAETERLKAEGQDAGQRQHEQEASRRAGAQRRGAASCCDPRRRARREESGRGAARLAGRHPPLCPRPCLCGGPL